MSGRTQANPYAFPPKYTKQLLHKERKQKDLGPTGYQDWKKWNLARDGAEARLSGGKSSKTRRGSMSGAAVWDSGVRKSKKRASTMAEVEGRLFAKAAEYAAPLVRLGEVEQTEVVVVGGERGQGGEKEEAEEGSEQDAEEAGEAEEESEQDAGEEAEEAEEAEEEGAEEEEAEEEEEEKEKEKEVVMMQEQEEVEEEGEGDEELEVTAQLQRESERQFEYAPEIAGEAEEGTLHARSSKKKRRVTIDTIPKITEIEDIEDIGGNPPPLDSYLLEGSPDLEFEDIYDMSEDYRGSFERPTEPVEKTFFPTLPRPKTEVMKQAAVVEEWEALVEKRKALEPYDVDLVKHTEGRLQAHRAELERLIAVEPSLPEYSTTRIEALKMCLTRYENADEIVNVKAVIKAFEDKILGNYMDQWTVFYNGKIVDRINSYRELLWSVRDPLYKEVYGSKGSIWIEPPTSDLGKACVMIESPQFVSGSHWYVKQNICLPWYREKYALELDFLLDSGATDPLVDDKDLLDLGLIKKDCPHVTNRNVNTASGRISVDFYPLYIQHLDQQKVDEQGNKQPLYPFMDTIIGITARHAERLSGLDIYRFCYVASEPSTGHCSYHPRYKRLEIRRNIAAGGTMTPRAWFTRTWDNRTQRYTISSTICSLTGRQPRLLNPDGDRWVTSVKEYPYQYGREDRSPFRVGYIPGHKVHPPTPDAIRDDRKYYWSRGLAYRDDRPFVAPRLYPSDKLHYPRDQYYDYQHREGGTMGALPTPRPLNPWQFKAPEQYYRQPTGQLANPPINPLGVMYWDRQFPPVVNRLNIDQGIVPKRVGMHYKHRKGDDYWNMRNAYLAGQGDQAMDSRTSNSSGPVISKGKLKRPNYFGEEGVQSVPEGEDRVDQA